MYRDSTSFDQLIKEDVAMVRFQRPFLECNTKWFEVNAYLVARLA